MTDKMLAEQKARVRRLLRRHGWTYNACVKANDRIYANASKRAAGKINRAYIGAFTRLPKMTDEQIVNKIPVVA